MHDASALEGKQLLPRELAAELHFKWPGDELPKAVAVSLGESQGFIGAWHDNLNDQGDALSRDCGFIQINIPASEIGTDAEFAYRTDSADPDVYGPVVRNGVVRARALFDTPQRRAKNLPQTRRWQPWVAYTTGLATFPEWWVWHQDVNHNPIGPWIATGRYIHRGFVGVANYHLLIAQDKTPDEAVEYARTQATRFHVSGTLGYVNGIVKWVGVPAKPTSPPADGVGPRPVPNDGI